MSKSLKPSAFEQLPKVPSVTLVYSDTCSRSADIMPAFEEFAETYGTTSARKASLDTPLVAKINGRKYLSVLQGGSSSEIANQVQKFPTVIFQNGKGLSTTFGSRKTNADLLHGGWSAFLEGSGTLSSDESAGSSMEEWLVSDSETVSNYGSDLEGGSDMGIEQEAQQLLAEFPYDKNLLSSNTALSLQSVTFQQKKKWWTIRTIG